MKVLKFGGTSLGTAERMQQVYQLVRSTEGSVFLVLSAVSGTTNALVQIAALSKNGSSEMSDAIDDLRTIYIPYIERLFKTEQSRKRANQFLDILFAEIRLQMNSWSEINEKWLLAQGEIISTHLFFWYAQDNEANCALLPALDFMCIKKGEPEPELIRRNLEDMLNVQQGFSLCITQGYICRNEHGAIDNLRRGGSDYTASLIGAAIRAEVIQIWTDIDGVHNNDPRFVKPTYPIRYLSFDEAAEMAYFGAKILHPASVLPARQANIPVLLKNTLAPKAFGTMIIKAPPRSDGNVKAVAAKDKITAINIRSSRMLMAYGFLRRVFEVFERFETPIDMITTSEVAVSVTIDDDTHLDNIVSALGQYGVVRVDREQTIVCVVGAFSKNDPGIAAQVLNPLKDIPIRMISSGGSESNISVLIHTANKVQALEALNRFMLEQSD